MVLVRPRNYGNGREGGALRKGVAGVNNGGGDVYGVGRCLEEEEKWMMVVMVNIVRSLVEMKVV